MRKFYPAFNNTYGLLSFLKANAFRKLSVPFILFFLVGFNNGAFAQPGAAWEYSRNIAISGTGTPLANYQIQVTLNAGQYGGMNADGSDLRFYVGATPCNYWVEKWNTTGTSVIWVKVPVVNTTLVTMWYGNAAATSAASAGTAVFDFFDDFTSLDPAVWSYGNATQSGSSVSLANGGFISNINALPITTPSFYIEAKHVESSYYRVRYYLTTTTGNNTTTNGSSNSPTTFDYGYFQNTLGPTTGSTFWNGGIDVNPKVYAGTNYITQWQITDNGAFNWATINYDNYTPVSSYNTTASVILRYVTIRSENGPTSVDWIRVRKSAGGALDPAISLGSQVQSLPTFISFTQNSVCFGGAVTVIITGTNFDNTPNPGGVTFNGVVAASVVVNSKTQITAVSQTGVTGGAIVVTTPGGTVSSTTATTGPTTLVVNPLPNNTFTVSGGGSYCFGGTGLPINLSGSELNISYQLLNGASPLGSPVIGNGSGFSFGNQTATGSYSVLATNTITGCSQTLTGSPSIIVNPLPAVFNVTGTGSYCTGGSGVAVDLDGSTPGVKYQLYSGATPVGTAVSGSGSTITFGYQPAGTYTVVATNTSTTCTQNMNGNAVVTMNPLPSGTLGVTENSGNGPINDGKICVGDPITFTAPTGYSNYTFKVNGTPVSPQPGGNVFTTSSLPTGNPTVTADITDSKTCVGTFTTLPITISVSTLPNGTFSQDLNNVCPNTKVTFYAPTGNSNYVFKVTNGGILKSTFNNLSTSSYSYTTLVNGDIVSVDVTNSNGCTKTFTAVPMVIKPMPDAAGAITGSDKVCQGSNSVPFSVPAIANVNITNGYTWTLPTGMTIASGTGTNNITVNFSNTATSGTITVAGTNGCGNGTSSPIYVTVNPLPTATIAGTAAVCQNSTAPTITFTGGTGSAPYTFSYNINGGATLFATSTGNTATITAPTNTSGTFTYNLIGVKDASATTCFNTIIGSSVTVTVNPLPTATIAGNTAVCQNGTNPTITFTGANGTAPYTFSYNINGASTQTVVSTGNTATITAPTNAGILTYNLIGVQDASTTSCSNTIIGSSVVVTVNPLPTATIANDANSAQCLNSTTKPGIIFTGSGGTLPYKFTYTDGAGNTQTVSTTSISSSVTVYAPTNVAGTFTYTLVSVQDATSTNCSNLQAGNATVTINSLPVPILSGPDQICPNDISDYSTLTGQTNYIWTITGGDINSGGTSSSSTAQIHWHNDALPKSIYVNYTDANGCSGNTSVSVISTAPTTPVITGVQTVCLNSTGNVYSTQSTYSNYVWTITGGTITSGGLSSDNTATVSWNTSGPQTISVNFNSGLCSAPAPTAYHVTVNPLPTAAIATNNASICQNDPSLPVITFTGANGVAPYTFTYSINGTTQTAIISTGNTATVTVPTSVVGPFNYQLVNVSGTNTCAQAQTNAVTVTVNPLPIATISGTTAVCKGSTPLITFTGSNGTAPYTFTYTINGVTQPTIITTLGNSITTSVSTTNPGDFTYALVSVKDLNGCIQAVTGQSATVTVNPLPTATIAGPPALCLNDIANITFNGANGSAPYTFTYTIDGTTQTVTTQTGNSITVPITTSASHTFTYKLVSVQDASTTVCVQNQSGTVTVLVSPVSVGGTITLTGANPVCTGANSGTLNLDASKVGNVVRWESSVDGGITWNSIPNTTSSLTYTNLTATTQYRAVVQSGTCTEATSNAITITVNTANGGTLFESRTVCADSTGSISLSNNSGTILRWETSTDGVNFVISPASPSNFINYLNITQTTWFRALSQASPCATIYSDTAKVTVNPLPSAKISGTNAICIGGGSATLTITLTGAGTMNGTVSDGTNSFPFTGTSTSPATITVTPSVSTTYNITSLTDANTCSPNSATLTGTDYFTTVVVNPLPSPVVINPGNTTICSGTILPLTSVLNTSGNFVKTYNSTPSQNNITIPKNTAAGISSVIAVPAADIPAGSIIDSVAVNFNITHGDVSDLAINFGAPNGKVITLAAFSLTGKNLTNTTVSSRTSQYPVISTGTSPYSGIYSAEGDGLLTGAQDFPIANTRSFTDLFGTPLNPPVGNWSLKVRDNYSDANIGTLNNWSLTIYYHVPVNPVQIVWSPIDSLFTDPSATVKYTGNPVSTVYARPIATTTYTGRSTDANSCTTASNVTITVTPAPAVTITPDYCAVPNKVQLTVSTVPAASSYIWSTGEKTQVIAVDEAKLYSVSATTSLHCVATGSISIAQELVKNGNFEAGNNGFFTNYGYVPPPGNQTSLQPEGLYAVDTNANNYHNNFFGKDHTTPAQTGKFMIINGAPGTGIIWQEIVPVLPNTNYYYSAWAMNLNNVAPQARLQFSVNGVPIGTIADLTVAPKPTKTGDVNINNWVRFYYGATNGWFSGSATTAVIQIIDLETNRNGNDFGLDDISFATLSTFITLTSAIGTDAQTVCRGVPITNITYSVGSGGTPTVVGLPKGIDYDFKNGITLVISGTPNDNSGVYTYTISTTGSCSNPTTATGTITVNGQKVTLSSAAGTDSQSVCLNTPIVNIQYTLSQFATNAVVTGLPAGVTPSIVSGNKITISGTPTVPGSFTYKIKTTGTTCLADSLTGTINSTVQTISTVTNNIQPVCINKSIDPIIYTIGGTGTGAKVDGLPSGVNGTYDPIAGTYTLSGKPTQSGTFGYTVTTLGSCDPAAATGIITVSPDASISLSSGVGSDAQTICYSSGINNITYTVIGATDANIIVSGLPLGFTWGVNNGTVTISGTPDPSLSGSYTYKVDATGNCVPATMSGTITVDPLVNTGILSSVYTTLCTSPTGTLTLTGSTGTINRWESSIDGGLTWQTVVNTNPTYNFSISTTTYYRVVLNGGKCGDFYSNSVVVGVHNLWSGKVSIDWNDANNWSDGNLPSTACDDVVIPGGTPNQPTLGSGVATITNLKIYSGATLTVNNANLQIAGTITNAGTFIAKTGTIELNSTTSPQTIDGSIFQNNALGNFILSNSTSTGVTVNSALDIYRSLTFGANGKNLNTSGLITLKSSATETAWVGVLNLGNKINGDVTVERYISSGVNHAKSWQLLAVPTQGQTINASWMEGASGSNITYHSPGSIGNPNAGYGTMMTSNVAGAGTFPSPGFDVYTAPGPSIKVYNHTTNDYDGPPTTQVPIYNQKGYLILVRGDRSIYTSTATANPTILRTKGTLFTPALPPPSTNVIAGLFESVGNPYASAIDMHKISRSGGVDNFFYLWDPELNGAYGLGGYQTLTSLGNGDYTATPGGGSYPGVNNYIQSGQAFIVQATGTNGTVNFNENSKASGSSVVLRGVQFTGTEGQVAQLRANLYNVADAKASLADGNLIQYNKSYSNKIDGMDARKMTNSSENFGIMSDGIKLVIERRQGIVSTDTIFYNLTGVATQDYRLEFTADGLSAYGLQGYVEDTYLNTKTVLNSQGITDVNFSVTSAAGSKSASRFRIVFKTFTVLPVTFVSVKATQKDKDVVVEWNVENESNMMQYEVEKSNDGISFSKIATVAALNKVTASYHWIDQNAEPGYNYYRIRSIDKNGKIAYSTIIKVLISSITPSINIYPNPITDGIIHLRFINQPQGRYGIRMMNSLGQIIVSKQISHAGGNASEDIKWDYNLAHGIYHLEVSKPNGEVVVIKVMY